MVHIKDTASVRGLRPELFHAAHVAGLIFKEEHNIVAVITCGTNGTHSHGSLHYVGQAIDLRTRHIPGGSGGDNARTIAVLLKQALGREYDVVLESDHIHVEFQPKEAMK